MQRNRRPRRISKLPPFASVVVPMPTIAAPLDGMEHLAEGFANDFSHLLERLGGVRVHEIDSNITLDGQPNAIQIRCSSEDPDDTEVDGLLAEFGANWVVGLKLEWEKDDRDAAVRVTLRGEGGEWAWTGRFALADGAVWQSRLSMGSELIAAATGEPIDVRPLLAGGPRSLQAYRLLCEARADHLDPAERLKRCQQVVEAEPDLDEAWLLLVDLLAACGHGEEAEAAILGLPERLPHSARARLKRGLFLLQRTEQQAAVADIRECTKLNADGSAMYEAGRYLMALGDESDGTRAFQQAVDFRCADPFLYEQLGVIRANEGQEVAAVVLWERAIALEPTLLGVLANLALGHHRLGNEERADELFVQAEEKASDHFATHYNLGLYYQDLRNWGLALRHLARAIALRPSLAILHLNQGLVLVRLGRLREARRSLREAMDLDPGGAVGSQASDELSRIAVAPVDPMMDAREYFQKGADRIKANRADKAIPYLKEAVKISPRYWQAWFYLGTCYRLQEKWEAAVEAFRRVVSIKDDQADAHNELSVSLGQLRRRKDAVTHARRAHDLRPDDPGIISNLGLALMEAGRFDEARHQFQRAAKLAPDDEIVLRCIDELEAREKKN